MERYLQVNLLGPGPRLMKKERIYRAAVWQWLRNTSLWDNVEKYCIAGQATDDIIIRRMRFSCWIPKATNTHSEYVIPIAFPRQQQLNVIALVLCCTALSVLLNVASEVGTITWIRRCDCLWFVLEKCQGVAIVVYCRLTTIR